MGWEKIDGKWSNQAASSSTGRRAAGSNNEARWSSLDESETSAPYVPPDDSEAPLPPAQSVTSDDAAVAKKIQYARTSSDAEAKEEEAPSDDEEYIGVIESDPIAPAARPTFSTPAFNPARQPIEEDSIAEPPIDEIEEDLAPTLTTSGTPPTGGHELLRAHTTVSYIEDTDIQVPVAWTVGDEEDGRDEEREEVVLATHLEPTLPWWKGNIKFIVGTGALVVIVAVVSAVVVVLLDTGNSDPSENEPPKSTPVSVVDPFYAKWRLKRCENDPSGLPDVNLGQRLFQTVEECCLTEFSHLPDDECQTNSWGITRSPTAAPIAPQTLPADTQIITQSSALELVAEEDMALTASSELVAIWGNTAVVGAPYNDREQGAAFVFVRDDVSGGWSQQARLVAPTGSAGDVFGNSVDIYNGTVVVGARYYDDDVNGPNSGSAHVFVQNEDTWTYQAKLIAPDGAQGSGFGSSVGISGDAIVVGVPWDGNDSGDQSGSAHVFVRINGVWQHEAKLLAPDGASADTFGYAVAIHEDQVVVGARGDDDNGARSGSVHMFARNKKRRWKWMQKLLAPEGSEGDEFGWSVSMHRGIVTVGSYGDDDRGRNSGSAHVFVQDEVGEWSHQAKLTAPDNGVEGNWFGDSVGVYDDTIVVGSYSDDDNGKRSGSVHIFKRTNGESWTRQTKLLGDAGGDELGSSVAIHNGTVLISASGSGSVFSFDWMA